jgi:formylglycine-generating enzyme required for sulfatase activity
VGDTSAVGDQESGASPYGVLNMAGNVSEWVNDWFDPLYYGSSPGSNPPGPPSGDVKVIRGGSFFEHWYYITVWTRFFGAPEEAGGDFIGFRCAADPS